MNMAQIASDFNIHGSGFLERQDLRWENASVACHEKTDNAGDRGVRGDRAAEEFDGQDTGGDGCVGRSRQEAHEADCGKGRPVQSQHVPKKASRRGADEQDRHDQTAAAAEVQCDAGENRLQEKEVKEDLFPPEGGLNGFEAAAEKLR